jgi:hypothetical protein
VWTLVGILTFFTIEVLFQEKDETKVTKPKSKKVAKAKKSTANKNAIRFRSIKVEIPTNVFKVFVS